MRDFAKQVAANTLGTLIAGGILYAIGVAAGLVDRVDWVLVSVYVTLALGTLWIAIESYESNRYDLAKGYRAVRRVYRAFRARKNRK
jgi:heme/copper-type cytochrome/quinol oxidase subunit 3